MRRAARFLIFSNGFSVWLTGHRRDSTGRVFALRQQALPTEVYEGKKASRQHVMTALPPSNHCQYFLILHQNSTSGVSSKVICSVESEPILRPFSSCYVATWCSIMRFQGLAARTWFCDTAPRSSRGKDCSPSYADLTNADVLSAETLNSHVHRCHHWCHQQLLWT